MKDRAGTLQLQLYHDLSLRLGPRLGVAYQLNSKTVIRAGWGIVYGQTPVLSYFTTATVGVGFNTLNLSNSTGLFGDPALYLKDGLQYNFGDLYAATYDPGVRPDKGTINSPPSYLSPQGGRPPRINQWNIAIQREILPEPDVSRRLTSATGRFGFWPIIPSSRMRCRRRC